MSEEKCRIELPFKVDAEKIGLPTGGAVVDRVFFVRAGETCPSPGPTFMTGCARADHFCLYGAIHPFDPAAQDIQFMIGLPVRWNGKAIQSGGGGLDGFVPPASGIGMCADMPGEPDAIARGYAVFGCDSGHVLDPAMPVDCSWGLNEEMLENFGWKALKKTHDVAMTVIRAWYGRDPERVYFFGGSNGGREAFKILQRSPEDYEGAIVFFPVIQFLTQMIADVEKVKILDRMGPAAVIGPENAARIRQTVTDILDMEDGLKDGIISCRKPTPAQQEKIEQALRAFLSGEQVAFMRAISEDYALPYPVNGGSGVIPGFQALLSADPGVQIGCAKHEKDNYVSAVSKNMVSCFILKDPEADPLRLDVEKDREAVERAAEIIQSDDPDLDAWFARGGRLILIHGNLDPLAPTNGTIRYVEALEKRYGPSLKEHLFFSLVPGYGHGDGSPFKMYAPMMEHLENWVEKGIRPETILATDVNQATFGRTRPLFEYPCVPVYRGEGDPDRAESFIPKNVAELGD